MIDISEYTSKNWSNNSNNRSSNNQRNNEQRKFDNHSEVSKICDEIRNGGTLSNILTPDKIFLPNGYANKIAMDKDIKDNLNTSQLRKIFDMIITAKDMEFDKAKDSLYRVLPHVAYATGRKVCPKSFYKVLETCISPSKLKSKEDVESFVDFIESIVAYAKYNK